MKPSLLSGIQPTGTLHLGNYLGALKHFVDLQNSERYQCYFFIADLHSLTIDFDPQKKKEQTLDLIATYLAVGLDPKRSIIFVQSHIPAHSELAWVFNTITPFGELSRMTQFKEKSDQHQDNINVGLFTYPTLMAADILMYDPQFVPVGEDQVQHLELTRTLARKFNNKFGQAFTEPQALMTSIPRLMSLTDPEKKMSKSQPDGCLFLDDSPEMIEQKIMSAVTDSGSEIKYDPQNKAGLSNLLTIYSSLSSQSVAEMEKLFVGKKYAQFKKSLTKLTVKHFAPFRRKKQKLLSDPEKLIKVITKGSKIANKVALEKIILIKNKLGLLN